MIARRQWLPDDTPDDARQHFEMLRAGGSRFTQMLRNGTAAGFMHSEGNGATADAVYAEREIQNRTQQGQKPDRSEPECSGARIAFMKQDVNRGEQRGQNVKARD